MLEKAFTPIIKHNNPERWKQIFPYENREDTYRRIQQRCGWHITFSGVRGGLVKVGILKGTTRYYIKTTDTELSKFAELFDIETAIILCIEIGMFTGRRIKRHRKIALQDELATVI